MVNQHDSWWASLTITQKEHIAYKIATKMLQKEGEARPNVTYPHCTTLWNSLDDKHKQSIHDHCTDSHGMVIEDWQEGQSLSY